MKRIVIDIGHGRNTFPPSKGVYLTENGLSDKPTNKVFEEHDFNAGLGVLAREKLKAYDVEVLFTQEPNADDVPLAKRIEKVNAWHKEKPIELLISIHANAHYVNSPAGGFESYHWVRDEVGKAFCMRWNQLMAQTGMTNRGVKVSSQYKNSWYIVRKSPCPAVLLEHFFYTNYAELVKFSSEEWIEKQADILAQTIAFRLNLRTKEKPKKENKDKVSDWAEKDWEKAVADGIVDGTNPQGNVTREMMVVMMSRNNKILKGE